MSFEQVKAGDFEPQVYVVVCSKCDAPLHFLQPQEWQAGNLVNQVEEVATALRYIAEAIEKCPT